MKSLFNAEAYTEVKNRLNKIDGETTPEWGKMNAGQMVTHCQKPLEIPLEKASLEKPNFLMKLLMRSFKTSMYNDKLWKPGMPTAKSFTVTDVRDFEPEKQKLIALIDEFHEKGESHDWMDHPAFGKFTTQQWGQMQYKHLDHHLRQFGA